MKKFMYFITLCTCTSLFAQDMQHQGSYTQYFPTVGIATFFVGVMGALWAQRANRSPWLLFFYGWLLAPFACWYAYSANKDEI